MKPWLLVVPIEWLMCTSPNTMYKLKTLGVPVLPWDVYDHLLIFHPDCLAPATAATLPCPLSVRPPLLLDFQDQVVALQGGVGSDVDRLDGAGHGGVDHRLHLHGWQDAERLTLLHLGAPLSWWRRRGVRRGAPNWFISLVLKRWTMNSPLSRPPLWPPALFQAWALLPGPWWTSGPWGGISFPGRREKRMSLVQKINVINKSYASGHYNYNYV